MDSTAAGGAPGGVSVVSVTVVAIEKWGVASRANTA